MPNGARRLRGSIAVGRVGYIESYACLPSAESTLTHQHGCGDLIVLSLTVARPSSADGGGRWRCQTVRAVFLGLSRRAESGISRATRVCHRLRAPCLISMGGGLVLLSEGGAAVFS